MKLIYLGSTGTTDCDFPLLREFQRKGLDFVAYYIVNDKNRKQGLISIDKMIPKDTILKASEIPAFAVYSDYIDLDNIYVINEYHHRTYQWQNWLLWWRVFRHMSKQKGTIFHSVWPLLRARKMLYWLKAKKVLTVHDPFPHSSLKKSYDEQCRQEAFDKSDSLILLNSVQLDDFIDHYHVDKNKIKLSRLGEYECLRVFKSDQTDRRSRYVLFFGQIQSHKGVDILLEAMVMVHAKHPDVKLVVAGKGQFHFDIKPYESLGYVEFINRYITVPELATLLSGCAFAVSPYRDATQSGVVQTAFSADVPLVVSDVGALPAAVKDGVFGLVVPPEDPKALAKAIDLLLSNPQMLDRFRENIKAQWRPEMTWEPIANDYIECYTRLSDEI